MLFYLLLKGARLAGSLDESSSGLVDDGRALLLEEHALEAVEVAHVGTLGLHGSLLGPRGSSDLLVNLSTRE